MSKVKIVRSIYQETLRKMLEENLDAAEALVCAENILAPVLAGFVREGLPLEKVLDNSKENLREIITAMIAEKDSKNLTTQ